MNSIVAVNSDWGIGLGGTQSVVIPEDRRHFRTITEGGIVIAGRKTFAEICKPLQNRKNIVLTRNKDFWAEGIIVTHSVEQLLSIIACEDTDRVFVIGGGEIYSLLLSFCTYSYVTKIDIATKSDCFFPNLDLMDNWSIDRGWQAHACGGGTEKHIFDGVEYSFLRYKKSQK